ncbi:MAG: ABC-type transport auxiliary lipoprotein family protein [Burkholderiaceae bacterium]|nr:ABC-type transport auxiliary lipoprotein family protein [Burkholderiaceae bacterium]
MTQVSRARAWRSGIAAALLLSLGACGSLLPEPPAAPTLHLLTWRPPLSPAPAPTPAPAPMSSSAVLPQPALPAQLSLRINEPLAAAGFDSRRIIYLRQPYRLDYYARHEWADTPARMLAPLLQSAFAVSGLYRVVVSAASAANTELSLDTEIMRLQQDFSQRPSQLRLSLRASLLDNASRRVLASREFDVSLAAPSEDAQGGVTAANLALQQVLADLLRAPEFAPSRAATP